MEFLLKKTLIGSFIHHQFVESSRIKTLHKSVVDQKKLFHLFFIEKEQIHEALTHAKTAFSSLKSLTAYERSKELLKCHDLLLHYKKQIAEHITHEMGKTLQESFAEVDYSAGYFHWYATQILHIYDFMIPSRSEKQVMMFHEPVGPVAIITPWNFPLAMAARKIAAAVAAGCPVICKPAHETPVTLLLLAALFQKFSLPPGTLQVLIGDGRMIGDHLLQSEIIRKISFTGSTLIGKMLYQQSAATLKKLTLELGGSAPFIVFEDADLDLATSQAILAKLRNNGQSCVAATRFFIHQNIYEDFVHLLIEKIKKLKIGNPLKLQTDVSEILHPQSVTKIQHQVQDAQKKGADLLLEAFPVTVLGKCNHRMRCFYEETFAPLFPLMPFSEMTEAIQYANQTEYGLAGYIFSKNLEKALFVAKQLECGVIGINDGVPSSPEIPFGGVKESGFGREGGPNGIYEYLVTKTISKKKSTNF